MIKEFITRARFLFFRRKPAELNEELQFHLEHATAANIAAGMAPEEAHREALVQFGGVEATREQCHEEQPGWWIGTVTQDARYALRGFRRNLAFTLTVIATLALGIGAITAVFSVVDRILFRALPYAHDDRLVSVGLVQPLQQQEFTLGGFFYEWQRNQLPFASLTFEMGVDDCNLTEATPMHLHRAFVAENFLPTLGIAPVLGRNFLPEEDQPNVPKVVLISYGLFVRRYNRDRGVLNKIIAIDGRPVRIIGVLPRYFEMPRLQAADIVFPAAVDVKAQHTVNDGIGYPMFAFARLKPGVTVQQAKAAMEPLFEHTQQWIPAEFRHEFHLQVRSIRDRQMHEAYGVAWVLLGAAFAVLLIACANVGSLFSARGAARERELAVRSALGASRGRLIRQTLTEAFLLSVAGAIAGCVLAEVLLRTFVAIAPTGIPFLAQARLDLRIIVFTVLVLLLCSALFGTIPALEMPRPIALVARQTSRGARVRLRRALVATQIGISIVLLCGASLLLKSFWHLQRQSLGMQTGDVLTTQVSLAEDRYPTGQAFMDFYLRAEESLRHLPGIASVATSNSLPPGDNGSGGIRYADIAIPGKPRTPPGVGGTVVVRSVTPGYFRILKIPILQGRTFTEEDRTETGERIVLSKTLAGRLFPQADPVGQHLQITSYLPYEVMGPTMTIVGVAANVKNTGLTGQDDPEYYTLRANHPELWNRHAVLLIETALPPSVVAPLVRAQIAQLDPTAPVEIETLKDSVSKLADRPRFETALVGFFALCGLLMAVIGLYGVIAYIASQSTQEIGIRMAVGATRLDILRLIAWQGARLILIGAGLGLAASLATAQLIKRLLYNVGPHDPAIYTAVILLLALVALIATLIPAYSAMRVEPVESLRCE